MLALATLLTLLADSSERLLHPAGRRRPRASSIESADRRSEPVPPRPGNHLAAAKLLAIAVLLLVIVGWRPRFTALPHWWISYSFSPPRPRSSTAATRSRPP